MVKEYGTPINGDEIKIGEGIVLDLYKKLYRYQGVPAKSRHLGKREVIENTAFVKDDNTYSLSVIVNNETGEVKDKFLAYLVNPILNGGYIEFTFLPEAQRFEDVKYSIVRVFNKYRVYSNDDIVQIQKEEPDHPLLIAMNRVLRAFEKEGSLKKVTSQSSTPASAEKQ